MPQLCIAGHFARSCLYICTIYQPCNHANIHSIILCLQVLKDGDGELVPVKRSIQGTDAFQMLPCSYCFGFYTSRFLKSHMATCSFSTKRARTTFPSTLNQTSLRTKLSKMSVKETQSLKCSSRLCDPKSNSGMRAVYVVMPVHVKLQTQAIAHLDDIIRVSDRHSLIGFYLA